MANIGIISEFNPFHTGHKHLINAIKEKNDTVICVMSGNFVQRGDAAIISKAERVSAALKNGSDLIIELPLPYALSSAQSFAEGGINLLKALRIIDTVAFGSELGEIGKLYEIADTLNSDKFKKQISEKIKSGDTFAKIRTDILGEYSPEYSEILKNPNNILGAEYILAAKKSDADFKFKTIKRFGANHDSCVSGATASASFIREKIISGKLNEIIEFLPENTPLPEDFADLKNLENAILYSLRLENSPERYLALPDVSEGIENRIVTAVKVSSSLSELYENIKTKRYTLSRIRRIILSAFLGIKKEYSKTPPPYIRVLGFTKKGEAALAEISRKTDLPIICTAKDINNLEGIAKDIFRLECRAADIWALAVKKPQKCGNEYKYKIVKE